MGSQRIEPHRITRPIQLLATWFAALVILDAAFLAAATTIEQPSWIPVVLTLAAIGNVPLFIFFMFRLQTRYRPEMQEDSFYSGYLRDRQLQIDQVSLQLRQSLDQEGLDLLSVAGGRSLRNDDVGGAARSDIQELAASLRTLISQERTETPAAEASTLPSSPEALLSVSRALMAEEQWAAAARYFDQYVKDNPNDWQAQFARGVAHANSRLGAESDRSALQAISSAIASAPLNLDPNTRARLFIYRAAMLKRLSRLQEAEADLRLAEPLATDDYEVGDLKYNLASVYAMTNRRHQALTIIKDLRERGQLGGVRAHLNDYFRSLADDPQFRRLLEPTDAEVQPQSNISESILQLEDESWKSARQSDTPPDVPDRLDNDL
jgi:tetratricopeptide (TPR) repeat protein